MTKRKIIAAFDAHCGDECCLDEEGHYCPRFHWVAGDQKACLYFGGLEFEAPKGIIRASGCVDGEKQANRVEELEGLVSYWSTAARAEQDKVRVLDALARKQESRNAELEAKLEAIVQRIENHKETILRFPRCDFTSVNEQLWEVLDPSD